MVYIDWTQDIITQTTIPKYRGTILFDTRKTHWVERLDTRNWKIDAVMLEHE